MLESITKLLWLPSPPKDFFAQCKVAATDADSAGQRFQYLANHRLTGPMAASLGRAMSRCRDNGISLSPLSDFRLGILSGSTVDLLVSALPAAAARHGVSLQCATASYGQVVQEALDPTSTINANRLDGVLLALDHHWFQLGEFVLEDSEERVTGALQSLTTVIDGLQANNVSSAVILQTVPVPPLPVFGGYDLRVAGTPHAMILELNRRICDLADRRGAYVLDVAGLATRIGTDQWFDPVKWHAFKLPFASDCTGIYADTLGRLLGAIRGKTKKCLVLDLDNTCWGGVIGDDGLEGIKIGQGSALGEAFLAVQRMANELRQRGIILAVSSKNNDDVARQPFREHPDMLLAEDDIAVFQANWSDKPSNLEAIAQTLNIGVDALVLLDDNPAERAQVRAALPMVGVPELPADPSWYPSYLVAAGYFEAVAYSKEDALRAASYVADTKRAEVRLKVRDLGDYLATLKMVISYSPFNATGRQRIAQLINKSNQFNLTTRRYSEREVAALEGDPAVYTLQVRLADSLGDLGMIAVVICREKMEGGELYWNIDTWLMSCRVLGRKVEEAMLAEIAAEARRRDVSRLNGKYIPTAKNGMVRDHYLKLGFSLRSEEDGCRHFVLLLSEFVAEKSPMEVRRVHASGADVLSAA
jgi:FkbH-like protein